MCDALVGDWKLVENDSDAFNRYMEAAGVGLVTRKAACALKPDVRITKDGDDWCIKTMSTFKNTDLPFQLDHEFDETTADGRKVKTTMTTKDGVLIQQQRWADKESTITREVKDGRLVTVCKIGDVSCTRVYDKK